MNALVNLLIPALTTGFLLGAAGCFVLIPVVAFKFLSVLFESDPAPDPLISQD